MAIPGWVHVENSPSKRTFLCSGLYNHRPLAEMKQNGWDPIAKTEFPPPPDKRPLIFGRSPPSLLITTCLSRGLVSRYKYHRPITFSRQLIVPVEGHSSCLHPTPWNNSIASTDLLPSFTTKSATYFVGRSMINGCQTFKTWIL